MELTPPRWGDAFKNVVINTIVFCKRPPEGHLLQGEGQPWSFRGFQQPSGTECQAAHLPLSCGRLYRSAGTVGPGTWEGTSTRQAGMV